MNEQEWHKTANAQHEMNEQTSKGGQTPVGEHASHTRPAATKGEPKPRGQMPATVKAVLNRSN